MMFIPLDWMDKINHDKMENEITQDLVLSASTLFWWYLCQLWTVGGGEKISERLLVQEMMSTKYIYYNSILYHHKVPNLNSQMLNIITYLFYK